MKTVNASVRTVVELILRFGDINPMSGGENLMDMGNKAHKLLQKDRGGNYKKEVVLSCHFPFEGLGITLSLEGRADGIYEESSKAVCIEEIKSTMIPFEFIDGNNHVHWGQVMCYAFMYAKANNLPSVNTNITYYHLETEEKKIYKRTFTIEELTDFISNLIQKYIVWVKMDLDWKEKRNASVEKLSFPYDTYRKGQKELAVNVYNTIKLKKKLYINAPTGIGKTISTIFPSIKAMATLELNKIFYLTAKTVTRTVAEEAFQIMKKHGLKFKNLTITAKDKICLCEKRLCNPEHCQYAKGHYDRINEAMLALLHENDNMTRNTITEYAEKYRVCPYEFTLDLSLYADSVICDYNYVFDPIIYLKKFFRHNNKKDYVFLIDEAHNLADRAREMYSAELKKSSFSNLKKTIPKKYKDLRKSVTAIIKYLNEQKKMCIEAKKNEENKRGYIVRKEFDDVFYTLLEEFSNQVGIYLKETEENESENQEENLNLFFGVTTYKIIAGFYDERYVTYISTDMEKKSAKYPLRDVTIKLFCLDPSRLIGEALKRSISSVIFSATLTPIKYYKEVLGGTDEDFFANFTSPFDKNNLCLLVNGTLSTKYKDREASRKTISDVIQTITDKKVGNYMVFFPSYEYMRAVHEIFTETYPSVNAVIQKNNLNESERDKFLSMFEENTSTTFVSFCVLGGIFSEGIDLTGNRLIGTIIVGVGLPKLSANQDIIKDYFTEKNKRGYEYAYIYPGMNKVLQAAGRVIRTETDKGVICLIDTRYNTKTYRELFPEHWSHYRTIKNDKHINEILKNFWTK